MGKSYSLVYSEAAADFLLAVRKARLASLLYDLRRLAENPSVRSDYVVQDEQGREIEHLLVGEFVISYWLDHAVSEIRIVDVIDVS